MSRRAFLKRAAIGAAGVGAVVAGSQGVFKLQDIYEQHRSWQEASRPNGELFAHHAGDLQRLHLGSSFTAQHWGGDRRSQAEAMRALAYVTHDLGVRQTRLGIRWSSTARDDGSVDLASIRPTLDYCLANDVDVCLNVGPVRTFRWPEEFVPQRVLDALDSRLPETITPESPLAAPAFDYLERLILTLQSEYGSDLARISTVQIENEPFYPLGAHRWLMSTPYLVALAQRVDDALPGVNLLLTSAGRLNLRDVRDTHEALLQADPRWKDRLVSGFDFHFRTPLRDSMRVVRNFDPITYARPFTGTLEEHQRDARQLGFRIEVTEGQAEPYDYLKSPGNSVRDFRFLVLRCLDKVFDGDRPALLRVWGVEELAKKALRGELTDEHRQIIEVFQTVNNREGEDAALNHA